MEKPSDTGPGLQSEAAAPSAEATQTVLDEASQSWQFWRQVDRESLLQLPLEQRITWAEHSLQSALQNQQAAEVAPNAKRQEILRKNYEELLLTTLFLRPEAITPDLHDMALDLSIDMMRRTKESDRTIENLDELTRMYDLQNLLVFSEAQQAKEKNNPDALAGAQIMMGALIAESAVDIQEMAQQVKNEKNQGTKQRHSGHLAELTLTTALRLVVLHNNQIGQVFPRTALRAEDALAVDSFRSSDINLMYPAENVVFFLQSKTGSRDKDREYHPSVQKVHMGTRTIKPKAAVIGHLLQDAVNAQTAPQRSFIIERISRELHIDQGKTSVEDLVA